jgi:hypothetical protein
MSSVMEFLYRDFFKNLIPLDTRILIKVLCGIIFIGFVIYFTISKENYSSIIKTFPLLTNIRDDTLIIPPFQESAFIQDKGDMNEYQYDNRKIERKHYPWLANTYLGQSQRPQDQNNPQDFVSF